jgi:tetratricopeptide (TPR) repeat protein
MTEALSAPTDLTKLVHGALSAGETRRLVRQLLTDAVQGGEKAKAGPDYSRAFSLGFSRLAERARELAREREQLPYLLARLRPLAVEEQRRLLDSDPDFHTWALCEWLLEECRDLTHAEPMRAEVLADLAVALTELLDAGRYGEPLVNDLRARSWVCAGDVMRSLSELRGAEEAFARAGALIASGTGDALEEAGLLEARAALLRDRKSTDEAHRLLDGVIDTYRRYRDFHLVGRAFVQKGSVHAAAHDLEAAVRWLRKGLGLIDPTRERRLELAARLGLMLALHESGQSREAWFLLKASRAEFEEHGGVLLPLRLVGLEGKLQHALGSPAEAERSLVEARQGFITQGAGFDAAAASLDLALLYAGQGRSGEMRRLAEEMLAIFPSRDLHREAVAALIVFQQAVAMDRANADLLSEIRLYLQQARRDPKLRFEATI